MDTTEEEIKLPTRQELIDTMLVGTTMWWEWVNDGWAHYFVDCKDVYDYIYTQLGKRVLIRQYDRVLSYEEKQTIFLFDKASRWFGFQENGKVVELKEWGLEG